LSNDIFLLWNKDGLFDHNTRPASATHSEMALSKAPQPKAEQKTVLPYLFSGSQLCAPHHSTDFTVNL
jgi:hypothetical protein